jgi:hypothetical protein
MLLSVNSNDFHSSLLGSAYMFIAVVALEVPFEVSDPLLIN